MSDKGFINQDFCSIKRLLLDRLSHQKIQFSRAEVAADFDIAVTSIYFKRLPRRVCEWNILNNVWPTQKIGLVASTWRSLYVSHALKRVFQDFSRPDTHTYVNLKMGVSRKQSTPNFPKNEHFLPPIFAILPNYRHLYKGETNSKSLFLCFFTVL